MLRLFETELIRQFRFFMPAERQSKLVGMFEVSIALHFSKIEPDFECS